MLSNYRNLSICVLQIVLAPILLSCLTSNLHAQSIPAGTIIPIEVKGISSEKVRKGQTIKGKIMQDVPLENGQKVRKGSSVMGHVMDVTSVSSGKSASLAIVFDAVVEGKKSIPVVTNLRAIASALEIEFAQIPTIGPSESDVYAWLATTQVGGEVVYGRGGEVARGEHVVGRSVNDGVLAPARAGAVTECRGAVAGNDRPQAMWVFSSDACGVYGIPNLRVSHAGREEPVGEIILTSESGPVRIRGGSGMLLRVQK
jgi:hypothetical protein